ncbi:short-chain dehydrogenase [Pedobacter sp. HMWF019]|uniref:SDR family NAD(P)-dependent oxidoreductase n=1 Tax=Pedobacter sp. HMWF019 TaxID=2056856 RepID=UPI000D35B009|nr:SDR family NAD(P)-dependent oxidoreductase [Pedobacter sp. HMWF019]PTT01860.1 short-chain dehydrogenase [Pedobacter sp. HMWF019]
MSKSILIIGAGEGLSTAVAEKFGEQGYGIGLISRNLENVKALSKKISRLGYNTKFATADAGNAVSLVQAIKAIKEQLGSIDVLLYNAAAVKAQDIMTETSESLSHDLLVNAGGALDAVKFLREDLKQANGSVLITGGGLANHPHPLYGSISVGKAAIRNLALQLHERLKDEGIYVGTLTINNMITPDSATHTPQMVAEQFWKLFTEKNTAELQY